MHQRDFWQLVDLPIYVIPVTNALYPGIRPGVYDFNILPF